MSSNKVLEIKTVQIAPFRTLMTALKDILLETNITFSPDGIRIINMDKSHTILAHLFLDAEKFEYFSGENEKTKYKHDKSEKLVNSYDNAIRYNDSIVREVIDKVKAKNTNSYVAYFSDHGDELYDTSDMVGHDMYNTTPSMYEVPFIVLMSEKDRLKHPEFLDKLNVVKRSYNLEDFIHSFSDLSGIRFNEYDATRSVFNIQYQQRKRIIKNGVDYDKE